MYSDLISVTNLSAHLTFLYGADKATQILGRVEKLLAKYPELHSWDVIMEANGQKKLLESAKTEHAPLIEGTKPVASLF